MFINKMDRQLTPKEVVDSNIQSPEIQVARLEMMLEVSRVFNATLDLNTLLQSIIEVSIQLTDTETGSVLLLEKEDGDFYFDMFTTENQEQTAPVAVAFDNSIAGWIVKNGETLMIDNLQEEDHFNELEQITWCDITSVLGVPLVFKEKIIGVIEVFNKHGHTRFSGDDIHTLNILSAQAAAAIENVRFFEQRDRLDTVFNELQSPMSKIIGSSKILLADERKLKTKDIRLGLENINREATRLSQMVNDFLNLTKIETGRVRMAKEMVDLAALTQEVVDAFYPEALEKKITLTFHIERPAPDIPGDAGQLKQVIANLVDNALKYNYEGGQVEVVLICNTVRVQLSVRDTGMGIPPKDLGLVFDKFYHGANTQDIPRGAGLGLAVAKKIIEAHQGDIWVQSEENAGSHFTFSLPLLDVED